VQLIGGGILCLRRGKITFRLLFTIAPLTVAANEERVKPSARDLICALRAQCDEQDACFAARETIRS
jgi:hypothetical protein